MPAGKEASSVPGERRGATEDLRCPSIPKVMRAQLRLVFRRRLALAAMVALTALPPAAGAALLFGEATPTLAGLLAEGWIWPSLLSLGWPLMVVWCDEGPSERAYHWTLPVDRPVHQLLRVAAGWVHLTAGLLAGLALAWAAAAVIHGGTAPGSAAALVSVFPAATAIYLVGTIPAVATDHPFGWLVAAWAATAVGGRVAAGLGWDVAATVIRKTFSGGPLSLNAAAVAPQAIAGHLGGPTVAASPWGAVAVWVAAGLALTVAVSGIHLERAGEG